MRADSPRWREVTASEFAHEREGLAHVRGLLPDRKPFRAWSNFEFRDQHGKWHEVDLLVLGESRLHLVELKSYSGTITGTAYQWQRKRHSQETPLLLAERKAKRLRSVIQDKLNELAPGQSRRDVPYIQHCILLHHKDGHCALPGSDKSDLFGRDDVPREHSGLPSIASRLLEPVRGQQPGLIAQDDLLVKLFDSIGFTLRREREVGSWRLTGPVTAEGDGWQDWPAEHRLAHAQTARIRFFVSRQGASQAELRARSQLVAREYELTRELHHGGLLVPKDMVDDELGVGLVYDSDEHWRPLDMWLADNPASLSIGQQVGMIRRIAETLGYAHRNHVVHRGLWPRAIAVDDRGDEPRVKLGDWQAAGLDDPAAGSRPTRGSATRVFKLLDENAVSDTQGADAYVAPEGRWDPDADRVRLDVFALGAVAYHIVAGRAPAVNATELRARVQRDNGLDLAGDMSEVPAVLRRVVLDATRPVVSERLADVNAFLDGLGEVEARLTVPGTVVEVDPLEARPGTLLGDRYELVRRMGSGSTAVGLLVRDRDASDEERVLKVALDDSAVRRLENEAETLRALREQPHPRLVRMVEDGVVQVGHRKALVLESAGPQTLADVLHERSRLSLDLLERWGDDLLAALVDLDKTGIDHRDIKPANLGVREQRGDRAKHLVLFDFSLARSAAESVEVGTPQYRDPFLGTGTRRRWDSAAERYAVAVTLHEMATGRLPRFGDGQSDPAAITDEATVDAGWFDPALAGDLVAFFRRALRRNAGERHHTATEMAAEWRSIFTTRTTTAPEDADRLAAAVTSETSLAEAGLSARALSAVEPLKVNTVGDLVRVDPARLSRLPGVSVVTRGEVRARAKEWRERFSELRGAPAPRVPASPADGPLAGPVATAEALVEASGARRATTRRRAAAVLLGLDGDVAGFATHADFTSALDVATPAAVSISLGNVQDAWAADEAACEMLDTICALARDTLAGMGGLAMSDALVTELARRGAGDEPDERARRVVEGLSRAALDRADNAVRGGDDRPQIWRRRRRRDGRVLLALAPALLDVADGLIERAEKLVQDADAVGDDLVPVSQAADVLRPLWPRDDDGDVPAIDDAPLVRLAARLSGRVGASRRGELHSRDLAPDVAVGLALGGLDSSQRLTPDDIAAWVRARFPELPPIPGRPRLDDVLRAAGLEMRWDGTAYAALTRERDTTGLASKSSIPMVRPRYAAGEDARLRESVGERSYLAIGVPGRRYDRCRDELVARYDAAVVDVTGVLVAELRAQATAAGIAWDEVTAADAKEPGSRPAQGLATLVRRAVPAVERAIAEAADGAAEGTCPVLVVEAAPLARYGHTDVLARLADITVRRRQAVWLLLPSDGSRTLDRVPVPLAHGGQFVQLGEDWLSAAPAEGEPT